jgi:hypothetical protein
MARKHNYLNNKDLLLEIHKSKNTYCVYRDPETDHDFDMILDSADEITQDTMVKGLAEPHPHATKTTSKTFEDANGQEVTTYDCLVPNICLAKDAKAKRMAKMAYDQAVKDGLKVKQAEFAIEADSYADSDIVFRVNEFEHVPIAPPKVYKTKPKRKKIVETKLLTEAEEEVEIVQVGKSHWKGEYKNGAFEGKFSTKHGHMTQKLALMFMKLCERYATKGNWRGYTYNDEMRGQALLQLSTVGLQFNEHKSQNPFAYYTAIVNNAFTRVLNIEKRNQVIRDDIMEANDLTPSYTRQNENDMAILKEREANFHEKQRASHRADSVSNND